jgi:hypothetical protein
VCEKSNKRERGEKKYKKIIMKCELQTHTRKTLVFCLKNFVSGWERCTQICDIFFRVVRIVVVEKEKKRKSPV